MASLGKRTRPGGFTRASTSPGAARRASPPASPSSTTCSRCSPSTRRSTSSLEVAPGEAEAEIAAAGRALGQALASAFEVEGCRRHGSAVVPADEALAHVALEASGRPLVVSNVDLSDARVGGARDTTSSRPSSTSSPRERG